MTVFQAFVIGFLVVPAFRIVSAIWNDHTSHVDPFTFEFWFVGSIWGLVAVVLRTVWGL